MARAMAKMDTFSGSYDSGGDGEAAEASAMARVGAVAALRRRRDRSGEEERKRADAGRGRRDTAEEEEEEAEDGAEEREAMGAPALPIRAAAGLWRRGGLSWAEVRNNAAAGRGRRDAAAAAEEEEAEEEAEAVGAGATAVPIRETIVGTEDATRVARVARPTTAKGRGARGDAMDTAFIVRRREGQNGVPPAERRAQQTSSAYLLRNRPIRSRPDTR